MKPSVYPGERYGRLVVLELLPERRHRKRVFRCLCDCGAHTDVVAGELRNGNVRSCGCLFTEMVRTRLTGTPIGLKHGYAKRGQHHVLYSTWRGMTQRCLNPRHTHYGFYGGRGITVCERWLGPDGFPNFLADMGERPEGHTLDRRDNQGPYSPANCKWATPAEQAANKRPPVKRRSR